MKCTAEQTQRCMLDVQWVQARAEELSEHEEQLEAWKQKFKAEALRQIGEREKTLADWQAKLDRKKTDLEEAQRSMEVWPHLLVMPLM